MSESTGPVVREALVPMVREAGAAILEVYAAAFGVEQKGDGSPLTAADMAADRVLRSRLTERFPDIPVVTEESQQVAAAERRSWTRFFLVDPLDGTKEFIRRNGEFTVNVALVEAGAPVVGVVGVPVQDVVFAGAVGSGATRQHGAEAPHRVQIAPPTPGPLRVVASRSHRDAETETFLSHLPAHETVSCGSSLKICRVAEGTADVYPRFGPTMEWDTAAAHAVLRAAGGRMMDLEGRELVYNKEDQHNPAFVATGSFDPLPFLAKMRH